MHEEKEAAIEPSAFPYVETPATTGFVAALRSGAVPEALRILDAHWLEVWYALDPADLKEILLGVPAEAFVGFAGAHYVNDLVGIPLVPESEPTESDAAPLSPERRIEEVGRRVGELRMSGRPAEALALAETAAAEVDAIRGRLVDTSQGQVGMWMMQIGITGILAGDLPQARRHLRAAADSRRPDRFPFVVRDAWAKLALVHAICGEPSDARSCLARAEQLPATRSWVESMIDDTMRLTRYICAVDALDLELAEEMRLADPSPFSHLEFWGIALQTQVRHLCITGRRDQARGLCDDVAAAGLPLPGSDGWVSHLLADSYLQCAPLREMLSVSHDGLAAELALAHRLHLLATGQFRKLAVPAEEGRLPGVGLRVRLGLQLLHGQGLLHSGREQDGRRVVLGALEEAHGRGTLGVLRFLTPETLALLSDTDLGARSARLVAERGVTTVQVVRVLASPLSAAETKVMRMLAQGLSRGQIAEAAYVSLDTVKSQLAAAYRKLGVSKRVDAITAFEQLDL